MNGDPTRSSRCPFWLWCLLGAALSWCPGQLVWAETEYFPIPAISTSKNDGNSIGLIVPFLVTNPDGELTHLVAPMVIHNTFVGVQATLNAFRYDPGGRRIRFIASYSEKIERKLLLTYTDPAFLSGRYAYTLGGTVFKDATRRFYGIGSQTPQDDETNYTAREGRAEWKFGVYLNEETHLALSQRYRDVQVQPGVVEDEPFSRAVFPRVPGMEGATILGNRVTFVYDSRDNLVSPTEGSQAMGYAELNVNFQNEADSIYYRYRVEFKKLFPSQSKRAVLVIRGDMQLTFGEEVPFYEQSSLGGQDNLRGYGEDRFIDDNLVSLNIEQRIHVLRTNITNVTAEFEIAPFVDMGTVFTSFQREDLEDLKVTPGIGFRGLVRPTVVGRVDYGYSDEGGAVFAGLDFPF